MSTTTSVIRTSVTPANDVRWHILAPWHPVRITIDPNRMSGLACIRDTRVTVSAVLGQLAAGQSIDEVLADYPYLERADILAALEFAAAAVQERELPLEPGIREQTR